MRAPGRFVAGAAALALALPITATAPAATASVAATASMSATASVSRTTAAVRSALGRQAAAPRILPPRRHGRLAVTGLLRDGGVVTATGMSWRPARLPHGDRLLSFEVGYTWQACPAGGKCRAAADSATAPFAARHYRVGHADTGSRLEVTETATEVVETDPATFAFSAIRASASYTTRGTARAFPAGRAPATEFVNGTPERRTASTQEFFQVDPPHYNAVNGPVTQQFRIDRGPWRTLGRRHLLFTGELGLGRHRVTVRTAGRTGATAIRFDWKVIAMPAPLACRAAPGRSCWYPPHLDATGKPMRWDWQIGRVTPLQRTGKRAVDIYDIDGFLTTRAQVHALHTSWQASTLAHPKAICYLDLAWEDYRPDGSPGGRAFPAATLGNVYFGFSQERWLDFRQLDALKPMLDQRIAMCARKGFDAVELDDIDSFDPPSTTGFHLTAGDAQNFLAYAFNQIHRDGMTGLWKNSPYLSWWGRKYADGAVVEECYLGRQCVASELRGSRQYGVTCTAVSGRTPCGWDDFSTDRTKSQPTGKWVGEAEYSDDHFVCNPGQHCSKPRLFSTFCHDVYAPRSGFAAVKFDADLDGATFYPCPRGE